MPSFTFEAVFREELRAITERRAKQDRPMPIIDADSDPKTELGLAGLALSGGGIRSATFSLGVIQWLIAQNVFHRFDYLSTVSGGGYLGACISNWYTQAKTPQDPPLISPRGRADPSAIAHLRDYSSYLAPGGRSKAFTFGVLVSLGLFINILLVLPVLITFALVFQLYFVPLDLEHPLTYLVAGFCGLASVYAIIISNFASARQQDAHRTVMLRIAMTISIFLAGFAFLAIQRPVVEFLYEHMNEPFDLQHVYVTIAGSVGVIGVFIGLLRTLIAKFAVFVAKFWRYALALLAPLVVWYVILLIETTLQHPCAWLAFERALGLNMLDIIHTHIWPVGWDEPTTECNTHVNDVSRIAIIYGLFSGIILILALVININSTSLHTFYRDRLQDAYLFQFATRGPSRQRLNVVRGLRLTQLDTSGPYHIINAAVNIQRSDQNLRGRNADFFIFSKLFVGGDITGYCRTPDLEKYDSKIDLATATAISGAAVTPNYRPSTNNYTIRFFMALVNARLGYWLTNPKRIAMHTRVTSNVSPYYFFLELFGLLDEKRSRVYVSDGGHIENLGLYELLRRRCKFIVVCDAECDPRREFHGWAHVSRLAYIDLGAKIDLNLDDLRVYNNVGYSRSHCTIGDIYYADGQRGTLLYVKPSITGDETEHIREYRVNAASFPHESTADQFFTEPQFEAYRALGYHSMEKFFAEPDNEFDTWFSAIDRKLQYLPTQRQEYINVQRQITEMEKNRVPQNDGGVREAEVRTQLQIMEVAVLSLGLDNAFRADGIYKNIVSALGRWAAEPEFKEHWSSIRQEFGDGVNEFVEQLLRAHSNWKESHETSPPAGVNNAQLPNVECSQSESIAGDCKRPADRATCQDAVVSTIAKGLMAISMLGVRALYLKWAGRKSRQWQHTKEGERNTHPRA